MLNFVVQVLVTSTPYRITCLSFVVQGRLAKNVLPVQILVARLAGGLWKLTVPPKMHEGKVNISA